MLLFMLPDYNCMSFSNHISCVHAVVAFVPCAFWHQFSHIVLRVRFVRATIRDEVLQNY